METVIQTAVGLVGTLNGAGPFTVFAPDDDAFTKLPTGTVDNLLKDKEKLTKILGNQGEPSRINC